jgi:uncharacterized membrane protein YGL010W
LEGTDFPEDPMKSLVDQLAQYGAYHRDRRNIATHFVGIPMIVVAVTILLSRPGFEVFGLTLSPAFVLVAASVVFYLALDLRYGLVMAVLSGLALWAGAWFAAQSTGVWLAAGIGLFVLGWILQFIGHYYEGRKPAFVDDVIGLVIGPLFVVAELGFLLHVREEVRRAVEARIGPTHAGPRRAPAGREP